MQRKIVSLVIFLSFICLIVSSLALYTWIFGGIGKKMWTAVHITGGLLFLGAGVWHAILNGKAVMQYITSPRKKGFERFFPLVLALFLTAGTYTTTVLGLPPAKQAMALYATFKEMNFVGSARNEQQSSLTLEAFCREAGLDVAAAATVLQNMTGGNDISPNSTFMELSQKSGLSAKKLFNALLSSSTESSNDLR